MSKIEGLVNKCDATFVVIFSHLSDCAVGNRADISHNLSRHTMTIVNFARKTQESSTGFATRRTSIANAISQSER
jgi:hypothetical protein